MWLVFVGFRCGGICIWIIHTNKNVTNGDSLVQNPFSSSAPTDRVEPVETLAPTFGPTEAPPSIAVPSTQFPSSSISPTVTTPRSSSLVLSFSPSDTCYWIDINIAADDDLRDTSLELETNDSYGVLVKEGSAIESHSESLCLQEGLAGRTI